jgi:hypothetical protein
VAYYGEPFMRIWPIEVVLWNFSNNSPRGVPYVVFGESQSDHDHLVALYKASGYKILADHGVQQWFNARWFIMLQLSNISINKQWAL